jgi:hypothetical protein
MYSIGICIITGKEENITNKHDCDLILRSEYNGKIYLYGLLYYGYMLQTK